MAQTPGPWRLVRLASSFDSRVVGYGVAYGPAGNRLAIVDGEGNSADRNEANAALIAAAPELLHAAHMALSCLRQEDDDVMARALRAAIAKAEGRS